MKNKERRNIYFISLVAILLMACSTRLPKQDYLIRITDSIKDEYGYANQLGDTIIKLGRYPICYTDTFKTYAIVMNPPNGFVAIDRQGRELYTIFPFDNGPDEPSGGLFRIVSNGDTLKIGYADEKTGEIVIKPRFSCAFPFNNGLAKVSTNCEAKSDGEHTTWTSNHWFYIDKTGKKKTNSVE